jgi:hypothetical protein
MGKTMREHVDLEFDWEIPQRQKRHGAIDQLA